MCARTIRPMPESRGFRRFVDVPNTWEGWAVRVLTMGVVLVLVVAIWLLSALLVLQATANTARQERNDYQNIQTRRVCVILRLEQVSGPELRELQC